MTPATSDIQPVETESLSQEIVLVTVHGDADLRIAPRLRSELERLAVEGWRKIIVDLSTAYFVDSAALGVLLGAAKRQRPAGGRLRVVTANPHVRRLFELTLIDTVFGGIDRDVLSATEGLR